VFLAKRKLIQYSVFALLFLVLVFFSFQRFPSYLRSTFSDTARVPLSGLGILGQEFRAFIFFHKNYWENKALEKENQRLKGSLFEKDALEQENTRLRDLLDLKGRAEFRTVAASVIGRDFGLFGTYLILDRGRTNGISKDDPVMTSAGLAGRVLEIGQYASRAILLNDPDLAVPAINVRTGEQGLVSGSLDGRCKLRFLDPDSDIAEGDMVATSGLNMTYPENIPIGRVKLVGMESSGLSKFAIIEPEVNLACLDYVLIVTSFKND